MRILTTAFLSLFIILSATNLAQARRGGGMSTSQELYHVWDMPAMGKSGVKLSVCSIHNHYGILFIPLWATVEDNYVLSNDGCKGEQYIPVEAAMMQQLVQIMPNDLPKQPEISMLDRAKESWGAFLAIGIFGVGVMRKKR